MSGRVKTKAPKDPQKITIKKFFEVQGRIIAELYGEYKAQTVGIIALNGVLISAGFVNLKFLEYVTNGVSHYAGGKEEGVTFSSIVIGAGLFLAVLFALRVAENIQYVLTGRYISNVSARAEKKLADKLSSISYEYYESNAFHEKISLAGQAGGQYSNAIGGITQTANILFLLALYGSALSKISPLFIMLILVSILGCFAAAVKVTDVQLDYWREKVSPESRKNKYFKDIFDNGSSGLLVKNRGMR
jgi:ABC-type multidrug transport system fused ATPase/permease subunit